MRKLCLLLVASLTLAAQSLYVVVALDQNKVSIFPSLERPFFAKTSPVVTKAIFSLDDKNTSVTFPMFVSRGFEMGIGRVAVARIPCPIRKRMFLEIYDEGKLIWSGSVSCEEIKKLAPREIKQATTPAFLLSGNWLLIIVAIILLVAVILLKFRSSTSSR